ncbi:hypothetical protein HYY73_03380 [Candidatus Woesearchaeota archaeon]|nr:hypothetical protein [Candidatus Woesearchaeota archaeon]
MKLTTIQLKEETRKQLEVKKLHPRESYDEVIHRMLESESIPSLEEVFRMGDKIRQKRVYTTAEVVAMTHQLR